MTQTAHLTDGVALAGGSPAATYDVVAVRYGTRETRRAEVFHDYAQYGEPDAALAMDYFFWLLLPVAGPPIVVDSGFSSRVGAERGRTVLIEPADALARLGIDPGAVSHVIVTHLHYDHIGNLDLFPNAEFIIPRAELEFWTGQIDVPAAISQLVIAQEIGFVQALVAQGKALVIDDAHELPGVSMLRVGGHSPGQLVLTISTAAGRGVLAGDAVHYFEELERNRPFALFTDLTEMYRGYETVRSLTAEAGSVLLPGHDPLVAGRFPRYGETDFAFHITHDEGGHPCG